MRKGVTDRRRFGVEERKDVYTERQRIESRNNPVIS